MVTTLKANFPTSLLTHRRSLYVYRHAWSLDPISMQRACCRWVTLYTTFPSPTAEVLGVLQSIFYIRTFSSNKKPRIMNYDDFFMRGAIPLAADALPPDDQSCGICRTSYETSRIQTQKTLTCPP
jgi:hypothetical protein